MEGDHPIFEERVEHGVLQGANPGQFADSVGRASDADVSLSVEYEPNIEHLRTRFEGGDDLRDSEIGALVRAGALDEDGIE